MNATLTCGKGQGVLMHMCVYWYLVWLISMPIDAKCSTCRVYLTKEITVKVVFQSFVQFKDVCLALIEWPESGELVFW